MESILLNKVKYANAIERGELAKKLLNELGIQDVQLFTDLSKTEIIKTLNDLQKKAHHFEYTKETKEFLAISIVWIGHKLMINYPPH